MARLMSIFEIKSEQEFHFRQLYSSCTGRSGWDHLGGYKDGGLNRFDEQAKEGFRWTALMESTDNKTGLPSNRLTDIVMLNDSVLLLTAEVNPLILLHTRNMEFRYIAPAKNVTDAVLSVRWDDAGSEIKDPFGYIGSKLSEGRFSCLLKTRSGSRNRCYWQAGVEVP